MFMIRVSLVVSVKFIGAIEFRVPGVRPPIPPIR